MLIDKNEGMVKVVRAFNEGCTIPFPYPEDNFSPFEEWYYENFNLSDVRDRIYLPIFWTGYYIRAAYGQNKKAIEELQGYLNLLDKSKKYYTIVQYDDGILNDLNGLDVRVYSMSGPPVDYPLPLTCMPHRWTFECERDILYSFVGRTTHPSRAEIMETLSGRPKVYISTVRHGLRDYCEILARSVFALCPRGYGPSSFRIAEALQYGAIPVYISDQWVFPHNSRFPGLVFSYAPQTIQYLPEMLDRIPVKDIQAEIADYYRNYITYDANKKLILNTLLHEVSGKDTHRPD